MYKLCDNTWYNLFINGNPQLIDIFCTGCNLPFAKSTFNIYNIGIENDIKNIIKLTPDSINCIGGSLRCRDFITPLYMACINTKIPIYIIELLLKNGANKNHLIKVNGKKMSMLDDLKNNISDHRYQIVVKLFNT